MIKQTRFQPRPLICRACSLAFVISSAGNGFLHALPAQVPTHANVENDRSQSTFRFQDVTSTAAPGLANTNSCWLDVNADGWPDLCADQLWINETQSKFKPSNQTFGNVVAADCDNDGDIDLFSWSRLQLWINSGDGNFTQAELPELPPTVSRGAAWGDFNLDGFADLYIGGYEDWDAGLTFPDLLLLNRQGTRFEVAWQHADHRARGVAACDFDQDGDLDVYVSNYRLQPNLLWLNDGLGELQNVAADRNAIATSDGFTGGHSIGATWADFDNDGHFDLFAGNFAHVDSRGDQPKSRFLQQVVEQSIRRFSDRGSCGVHYQESYATPAAADVDNDGDVDLFLTTVYATASFGRPNAPVLFSNRGAFQFVDTTLDSGLSDLPPTYQAAWSDFDRDGDLDLVTGGKLFSNQSPPQSWLKIRLHGNGTTVNRSAIGAQVRLQVGDQVLTRQVEAGTGEGNQNDFTLHFGLGDRVDPVRVTILWPGGETESIPDVDVGREHSHTYGDATLNSPH